MSNINELIGVYFELPKDSKSHINIDEILSFIDYQHNYWKITNSKTYLMRNNKLQNDNLFEGLDIISGVELKNLLINNYHSIFLSLSGFPQFCTYEDIKN